MSVAAHVSRVSKDYAPFGYSVMNRETFTFSWDAADANIPAGVPGGINFPLFYADQGGLWIESIEVMWPMGLPQLGDLRPGPPGPPFADEVGDQWIVDLRSGTFPGAGSPVTIWHFESQIGNVPPPGIPPGTHGSSPIPNGSQFVPDGSFLYINLAPEITGGGPGAGPAEDLMFQLHVRYRSLA